MLILTTIFYFAQNIVSHKNCRCWNHFDQKNPRTINNKVNTTLFKQKIYLAHHKRVHNSVNKSEEMVSLDIKGGVDPPCQGELYHQGGEGRQILSRVIKGEINEKSPGPEIQKN